MCVVLFILKFKTSPEIASMFAKHRISAYLHVHAQYIPGYKLIHAHSLKFAILGIYEEWFTNINDSLSFTPWRPDVLQYILCFGRFIIFIT